MTVHDHLLTGKCNALTGKYLCGLLGVSKRGLQALIMEERRAGFPICASNDFRNPGFYLAETQEEMRRYCKSLLGRMGEIAKTRRHLLDTIPSLPDEGQDDKEQNGGEV